MSDDAPDQEHPTVPVEPTPEPATEAVPEPTESMSPAAAAEQGGPATPPANAAAEPSQSEAEPSQSEAEPSHSKGGPRWGVALVLVLVLGVGGGFLLGRATAPDEGPTSLAEAVSETATGDLPLGNLDMQELLQSIGQQKGGVLGEILGGDSESGSGAVKDILGGLLDNLRGRMEQGGADDPSSDSGTSSSAVLGVKAVAAPAGQTGVLVQEVAAGSAAADGGLQANDVITAVDGTAVASPAELGDAVQSHAPGDQVTITYTRNGTSATVKVRLGNAASTTAPTTAPPTTQAPTNA